MKYSYTIQAWQQTKLRCCLLVFVSFILANCGGAVSGESANVPAARFPTPTIAPALAQPVSPTLLAVALPAAPLSIASSPVVAQGAVIRVDPSQNVHPISPLIYGMNQAPKELQQAQAWQLHC